MKLTTQILVTYAATATAQIQIGLKVGASLSSESTKTDPVYLPLKDSKPLADLNGGVYIEFKKSDKLSFQSQLNFRNACFDIPRTSY